MSMCSCDFDDDSIISDLHTHRLTAFTDTVCDECGQVVPVGDEYVLYTGTLGEYEAAWEEAEHHKDMCWELDADDQAVLDDFRGLNRVDIGDHESDFIMQTCPLCHRMRQDLEEAGYCIMYPGLTDLIEQMEDESDLFDLADDRRKRDKRRSMPKVWRNEYHIRRNNPEMLPTLYRRRARGSFWASRKEWVRFRDREIRAKAANMAEFWRRRAACETEAEHEI